MNFGIILSLNNFQKCLPTTSTTTSLTTTTAPTTTTAEIVTTTQCSTSTSHLITTTIAISVGYETWVIIVSSIACILGVLLILWLIMYFISPRGCRWYTGVTEPEPVIKPTANGLANNAYNSNNACIHEFRQDDFEEEPYRQPTSSQDQIAYANPAPVKRKTNRNKIIKKISFSNFRDSHL